METNIKQVVLNKCPTQSKLKVQFELELASKLTGSLLPVQVTLNQEIRIQILRLRIKILKSGSSDFQANKKIFTRPLFQLNILSRCLFTDRQKQMKQSIFSGTCSCGQMVQKLPRIPVKARKREYLQRYYLFSENIPAG